MHFLAAWADRDLLRACENCGECLFHASVEVICRELGRQVGHLMPSTQRIRIKGIEIFHDNLFSNELLPENGWEMPINGSTGPDTVSEESTHQLEEFLVSRRVGIRVERPALSGEAPFTLVIGRLYHQRKVIGLDLRGDVGEHLPEGTTHVLTSFTDHLCVPESFLRIILFEMLH